MVVEEMSSVTREPQTVTNLLTKSMPGLDDAEGDRVPATLTRVMDCHVHVFPDKIFEAIRKWFDLFLNSLEFFHRR